MKHLRSGHMAVPLSSLVILLAVHWSAAGKVIVVGPDQPIKLPSDAAKLATDGDTIEIEPQDGGYFDCAVWRANRLTIEGQGEGVIITDKPCVGKALFVVEGNDVTLRNLVLQRVRVPDKNGAGVRDEGRNLIVVHCRFINDEVGVFAAGSPASVVSIDDSVFAENAPCSPCGKSVLADPIKSLTVTRSKFAQGKGGDYILSSALETTVTQSEFDDGPNGVSEHLIELPVGGALVLRDNVLRWKPQGSSSAAVVARAPIGGRSAGRLVITGNHFQSASPSIFFQNWTGTDAQFANNSIDGNATTLSSDGYVWFQMKVAAHQIIAGTRHVASWTRTWVRKIL